MSTETLNILDQISREKGIETEILVDALTSAMEAAARKRLPQIKELYGEFNAATGEVQIFAEKSVVESVENPNDEITLKDAVKISPEAELGDKVHVPQVLQDYGRIAAQLAKQVILQKVREAEIDIIYNEYRDKKGELINGIVQRYERGDLIVDIGKAEGILPRREQVFRESFNRGERIRSYVVDVRKTSKSATVILSRTHVELIRRLFELEVPEISEGMVEIMGIVREPNGRTKISVKTNDRDIDAVGACVGMRGMRVQSIVQELRGEKIDIVEYSDDPVQYIKNALSPAKVSRIICNEEERHMTIIAADDQMSLAIGKKGQNVRLAAKLVKWKIDIKGASETEATLGGPRDLLPLKKSSDHDFLGAVKTAKGLGEKMMSILFAADIVNFEEALKRGIKGMTSLTGIGPKKAQAILELAQELKDLPPPTEKTVEQTTDEHAEDSGIEEVETEEGESEQPEEDEQEISIEELVDVDNQVINILAKNEFQTLAELSITTVEELTAIEGIDEEVAKNIIDQAKQRMEDMGNS